MARIPTGTTVKTPPPVSKTETPDKPNTPVKTNSKPEINDIQDGKSKPGKDAPLSTFSNSGSEKSGNSSALSTIGKAASTLSLMPGLLELGKMKEAKSTEQPMHAASSGSADQTKNNGIFAELEKMMEMMKLMMMLLLMGNMGKSESGGGNDSAKMMNMASSKEPVGLTELK